MTYRRALNPAQMTLAEVAYALGLTVDWIKKLRAKDDSPAFFGLAFKTGSGSNSPLRWWRTDVDAYLREMTGRGLPTPSPDAAPVPVTELTSATGADVKSSATEVMMPTVAFADLVEGFAQVLLDVAAKARAGEYN